MCCSYLTLPKVTFLEVLDPRCAPVPQMSVWLCERKEHTYITHANIVYYLGDEEEGQHSLKVCVKCV